MNYSKSEIFHRTLLGTSALVASAMLTTTSALAGGPTGGKVVVGNATITSPSALETLIDQSSNKALINWFSFSVSSGSSVVFEQPNSGSITVNRVIGPNASAIDGKLLANGNIWLINANGVLFGHGAQVNVGALLATTSDITDDDFIDGHYVFSKSSSNPNAAVVNQGKITAARGGSVVLSASEVVNEGVINANLGSVVLGGARAFTVDMTGDNLLSYQITAPVDAAPKDGSGHAASALVSNSGTIAAAGGHVLLTARAASNVQDNVVNNTGMIEATSVSSRNGEIDLDAGPGGTVNAGGTIDASGLQSGQTGGSVAITGGTVNVGNGAIINASGDRGGGTIEIGGGFHGQGDIANSQATNVGDATITADALSEGNGGKVAIWSDGTTKFAGTVSAKGGANGGSGGYVETSGGQLDVGSKAKVITSAAKGATGTWLLDPNNIDIVTGGTGGLGGSQIDPGTIINALATTNVELEATDDITIQNAVDYSSANVFTMLAGQNIIANAGVENSGTGALNLIAGWDGTTTDITQLTDPGVYGNNNGSILIGGPNATGDVAIGSAAGLTTLAAANLTIEGDNGYAQAGFHGQGGGGLLVDLTGNLSLTSSTSRTGLDDFAQLGDGSVTGDVSGNITGDIDINAAGTTALDNSGGGEVWIGNVAKSGSIESGSVTLITGNVTNTDAFGGADTLGAMMLADLGTTASAGSGGNFTLGITDPQTDFINTYLDTGVIDYSSPHALTLLSTTNITLPYSIQNDGAGDLTILAGWNPSVAPADVLTTPGAYGNLTTDYDFNTGGTYQADAYVWVVGAPNGTLDDYNPGNSNHDFVVGSSGTGTSIGSKGGTTTIGAGQIYVEGLTGYAQIGFHRSGGTGAIDVIANGTPGTSGLTGVQACFDGNANICVIGGRANENSNGNATYAQIGDLGLGVAGTASSAINISATGNIAVAGGGIYNSGTDPGIADAYGMIGNGDASQTANQTVSGAINVDVGGQMNFASSTAAGSEAWLGNRTGADGLSSGDLTLIAGSESDSGPIGFGDMLEADLGTTGVAGSGGNVTVGLTDASATQVVGGNRTYSSPHSLTILDAGNLVFTNMLQNSGTGDITLVAGWDGTTLGTIAQLEAADAYGLNGGTIIIGGENAGGNAAVGSAGGTTTVLTDNLNVIADNGSAQLGYAGAGNGAINVLATGNILVDARNNPYAQIGNGGYNVSGSIGGNISLQAGGNVTLEEEANCTGDCSTHAIAAMGNIGGANSAESGELAINALGALDISADGLLSVAQIGNFATQATSGGAIGNITITAGPLSLVSDNSGFSLAQIGDGGHIGGFDNGGASGGNIDITASSISLLANVAGTSDQARISNVGSGDVSGNITINSTGNIDLSAADQNLSSIGNTADGTASGNIDVTSGGSIAIMATGEGEARISSGDAADSNIDVTAAGNITLSDSNNSTIGNAGPGVFIGNFGNGTGPAGGNISVTSTGGSVELLASDADGAGAYVFIGNTNGAGTTSGDVSVSAAQNIVLSAQDSTAFVNVGDFDNDFSGTISGNTVLTAGGALELTNVPQITIGEGSGTTSITAQSVSGDISPILSTDLALGNFTLDLTGTQALVLDTAEVYSNANSLTLSNGGDIIFDASFENAGSGAISINSGGTVTIGGDGASGNVAVGSAGGTTSVTADNLVLDAVNGYAQLGYHGTGTGAIDVSASGDVTLTGGSQNNAFAQIGNGGLLTSGNESGDITVDASGNVVLDGGTGNLAYAQIGLGGAESNQNSNGYNDTGLITVDGQSVTLGAGGGTGSYAQIGNGGYESGSGLLANATAVLGGDIVVDAADSITLSGGGTGAYAQIGNGGDLINTGAGNGANGSISGNIAALAGSTGSLTLTAGTGEGSYVQIGNGGNAENTPADGATVDFSVMGDLVVSDLTLTASNSGIDGYAQVGNGDASEQGTGNISGNITLDSGTIVTTTSGKPHGAVSSIGNATGHGTVSGTVSGVPSGNPLDNPQTEGAVASTTQTATTPTDTSLTSPSPPPQSTEVLASDQTSSTSAPTPLDQLANNGNGNSEGKEPSDHLTESLGHSLERGSHKYAVVTTKPIIPGILTQIVMVTPGTPHGIPPADEDYSSWGNEALWRW